MWSSTSVGTPLEVFEAPANSFVAAFIGSPPMYLLSAQVTDGQLALDGGPVQAKTLNPRPVRDGERLKFQLDLTRCTCSTPNQKKA